MTEKIKVSLEKDICSPKHWQDQPQLVAIFGQHEALCIWVKCCC